MTEHAKRCRAECGVLLIIPLPYLHFPIHIGMMVTVAWSGEDLARLFSGIWCVLSNIHVAVRIGDQDQEDGNEF